jgi:hypothetical protein
MYNGRLGMEMLELFIPVKALDDWMLATGQATRQRGRQLPVIVRLFD